MPGISLSLSITADVFIALLIFSLFAWVVASAFTTLQLGRKAFRDAREERKLGLR